MLQTGVVEGVACAGRLGVSGEILDFIRRRVLLGFKIFKMCRPNMLQLLHVSVVWFSLLPHMLLCENLLCLYSPFLYKEETFELIVTECPPGELCYKADGRYGNHSALSARGCMAEKDCSKVRNIQLKGTIYTMSYTCCDTPYCNSCLAIAANLLSTTVTLVTVAVMASSL